MKTDTSPRKTPEHQVTYAQVCGLILIGHFSPGHPVTIQGLAEEFDAGVTPIREAIRRLTSEGSLEAVDNRRIRVPTIRVPTIRVPTIRAEKLKELCLVREFADPHLAAKAGRLSHRNG